MIPDHIKDRIKREANLRSLVMELTPRPFNSRGRCACPIHGGDDDPNFAVYFSKRHGIDMYKCHSKGCTGDAISFVAETQGMDFHEAARFLADRLGIEIPREQEQSRQEAERERLRQRQRELLALVLSQGREVAEPHLRDVVVEMPPLRQLARVLASHGYSREELQAVGFSSDVASEVGWQNGGRFVYALSRGRLAAMRPLDAASASVIGPDGGRSTGWVGLESRSAAINREKCVRMAVDDATLATLSELEAGSLGAPSCVMLIGEASDGALRRACPPFTQAMVVAGPVPDSRRRAFDLGVAAARVRPDVAVAELLEGASVEDVVNDAGLLFEWQAGLLAQHGALRDREGRSAARRQLEVILESMAATHPNLENDVCRSMMDRLFPVEGETASNVRPRSVRPANR
jgi:hypothetical protein